MITKNWYKIMTILQGPSVISGADTKIKNQFGNYISYKPSFSTTWFTDNGLMPYSFQSYVEIKDGIAYAYGLGTCFGSGGEQPTIEDIKLSGDCLNNRLSAIRTNVVTVNEDCGVQKRMFTLTNTSGAELTIREVGIFTVLYNNNGSGTIFMVEHTLLDTPVTIAPGGVGQVEHTITVNFPTA